MIFPFNKSNTTTKLGVQKPFLERSIDNITVNVFIMVLGQSQTKTRYFPPMVSENLNFFEREKKN